MDGHRVIYVRNGGTWGSVKCEKLRHGAGLCEKIGGHGENLCEKEGKLDNSPGIFGRIRGKRVTSWKKWQAFGVPTTIPWGAGIMHEKTQSQCPDTCWNCCYAEQD